MSPSARIKYICQFKYGDALPTSEDGIRDIKVFGSNGPYNLTQDSNTLSPVIVVGRKGSYGKVNWSDEAVFASDTTYFVDSSSTQNHLRWLYWMLQTLNLDTGSGEAAVPGLSREHVYEREVWLPPLERQQQIADYLDRETAQIDALIIEKETMLNLLEQKRAALVSRAVTRGLNPRVELKDSGLEWLGKIPAHWELKRLKFALLGIEQGWSPQCENTPALPEQWGVLKVGAVNGWEFEPEQNKALPTEIEPLEAYEIQPGDVLVSRANTINLLGSAALVRDVRSKLLLCDKLYRLRLDTALLDAEFLVRFLRSSVGRYSMEREASGTSGSMQNIGQDTLRNLWIIVPPLEEQKAVVRFIQRETRQVEESRREIERSAALLRERRSALITAAVTGQLALEEMHA